MRGLHCYCSSNATSVASSKIHFRSNCLENLISNKETRWNYSENRTVYTVRYLYKNFVSSRAKITWQHKFRKRQWTLPFFFSFHPPEMHTFYNSNLLHAIAIFRSTYASSLHEWCYLKTSFPSITDIKSNEWESIQKHAMNKLTGRYYVSDDNAEQAPAMQSRGYLVSCQMRWFSLKMLRSSITWKRIWVHRIINHYHSIFFLSFPLQLNLFQSKCREI